MEEKGNLTINKVDAETGKALAGVTYRLFDVSGNKVADATTGADGKAVFNDLAQGKYSYQEISAPSGLSLIHIYWDYNRTGVSHRHYFMDHYDGAKQDFAARSGLVRKEQLFSLEQMTEIYRCCADSVDGDFFDLTAEQEKVIRSVQQQIEDCVPDVVERIRQQEDTLEQTM